MELDRIDQGSQIRCRYWISWYRMTLIKANTMTDAIAWGRSKLVVAETIKYPSPSCDVINSPTTAPITESVMPIFRPLKMNGAACGNLMVKSSVIKDAPVDLLRLR